MADIGGCHNRDASGAIINPAIPQVKKLLPPHGGHISPGGGPARKRRAPVGTPLTVFSLRWPPVEFSVEEGVGARGYRLVRNWGSAGWYLPRCTGVGLSVVLAFAMAGGY